MFLRKVEKKNKFCLLKQMKFGLICMLKWGCYGNIKWGNKIVDILKFL